MNIQITIEGRQSIAQIQKNFENQLSEKAILADTASALNKVTKRVQGFMRREVRQQYTVNRKYLDRISKIRKLAKASHENLYTEIAFSYRPIPMVAFKHTGSRGSKRGINIQIRKGQSILMRHAFIAAMRNVSSNNEVSEHEGIYAAGRYVGKKFVFDGSRTASGKMRVSELKTVSPFTMYTSKNLHPKLNEYVNRNLSHEMQYYLQRRLNKLTKG